MQVHPINLTLKPSGPERLKLKYDEPPSKFAFEFNLRCYTLALLRLTESLLWGGAGAAAAMTPLLQHVFQEVLVQHGLWRYRRRADRWALYAAVVRVLTAALAPRPGPGNAARRAAVAGFVSGDAGAAAAALASLSLDAAALRRMHEDGFGGAGRAAEVAAAEGAVGATLRMLPSLLCVLADRAATAAAAAGNPSWSSHFEALGRAVQVDPIKSTLKAPGTKRLKVEYGKPPSILLQFCFQFQLAPLHLGSGPLAHALLVEAPGGGPPLAAAVASYAAYPYAPACCPLAGLTLVHFSAQPEQCLTPNAP